MKHLLSILFCFVTVQAVETVRIYHVTSSFKHLENIKKFGLCSGFGACYNSESFISLCQSFYPTWPVSKCRQLQQEQRDMVLQSRKSKGFADQMSVIYFKPEEPGIKETANVAIEVDPNSTYVYNMEHRAQAWQQNPKADALYRKSRVLLADYLKYLKEAEAMVLQNPNLEVQLDPETARPFYLEKNDARKQKVKINGEWVEYKGIGAQIYNGEVIVETTCIPSKDLIFLNDTIFSCPRSTPVRNNPENLK